MPVLAHINASIDPKTARTPTVRRPWQTRDMPSTRAGPTPLNAAVTEQMRKMPRHSTTPEMLLRRELHRRGLRYRIHPAALPGRPDIAFTRAHIAVFVDGCFWHGCERHGTVPKNNRAWWVEKLRRTAERDREKDELLVRLGWQTIHIWEHDAPNQAADRIEEMWREAIPAHDSRRYARHPAGSVRTWSSSTYTRGDAG
jgi:DNA mismatch endonuclease, patch repair protein